MYTRHATGYEEQSFKISNYIVQNCKRYGNKKKKETHAESQKRTTILNPNASEKRSSDGWSCMPQESEVNNSRKKLAYNRFMLCASFAEVFWLATQRHCRQSLDLCYPRSLSNIIFGLLWGCCFAPKGIHFFCKSVEEEETIIHV